MPIQHPTYALPLQSANTIATKQSHDAEINRVVTILVENDRDLNATFERAIVTGPIVGEWDAGTGAFPTLRPNGDQIRVGDTWRVIGNGTVDGQAFYSGDYLQAITAGGGVTFNGNWARAALGQIEADRIAAETAAAEAQAYAEMAEFTRVTVIASGDGTANPITLPISVDSALRVQVFVNMTRWVPGDDYTVSGYDLAPVSPLVWPEGDRNLLILIDRPFDSMAPTSDDVTHDGQPISQILDRIDAQNTFYLSDYLHPDDLASGEVGNTASQNETRVTAAVQAFHDAALGWMMTANNRHVTLVYPNIVLAINDEMFSEAWAELLYTTGGSRTNCRIVFQFNGVRFQTKNWVARAAVRTSGLYLERGITYPVPKVVFRYEAKGTGNPRIETQGRIYIFGSDNPDTDPIGLKFKSVNVSQFDCFFFQGLRNTAFYHENIFNSTFYNWQISSCGYQPTEYGGNGFMPDAVRFQNVGRVITATAPVFDASHVGRRFMLVGAAAANGQGFQTHSGVIESVDSPTQITLTAATAPFRNVTDPVVASFEAIKATTTAGSNVVTLSAPITDNLAGRYVTLFGCGQNDIAYNGQYYGAMTVVVTAHSGDQITLAHPARLSRTGIPISFGTSMIITRGAENSVVVGSMAGRTDDCTYYDARIVNGSSPFDGASMMALIQHCSSTAFVGGTKFHGVSARKKNNFGANFANLGFDYATGVVLPESIVTHGGYSASAGKIILTGGFTGVTIECDEVAYPDTTETATVLCDPTPGQTGVTLRLGNTRTDGRVGNAVKARYGAYGNAGMIVAANSAARLQRGLDLPEDDDGEDTIVGTGTTPAIPDWPTDLHDVIATGDVFAPGYGSARANAASRIAAGFWTPQNGVVYTIGGLQYLGQTGATAIADLPGLVWFGERDVRHFGAESGAADVLAAFVAARDSVPAGQAGKVIVPPGVWNISTAMAGNNGNFVEWEIQDGAQILPSVGSRLTGTTWRIQYPRVGSEDRTSVSDKPVVSGGQSVGRYTVINNTGGLNETGYGERVGYRSSAYGPGRFDIASAVIAQFNRTAGNGGGQSLAQWLVTVSPTTGDGTSGNNWGCFVSEWNIVNRGPDTGFTDKRSNLQNWTGGFQMVVEDDLLGIDPGTTKNATFGIMFAGQTPTGNAVDRRRYYAAILGEPDAIAGETGRAIYWTGDTTNQPDRIPLALIEGAGRWGHGVKLNTGTFDVAPVTLPNGSKISWQTSADVEQAYLQANATQIDASVGGVNALRVTSGGVQVTGLMTGTAVASSQTDATIGRLPVHMNYPNQTGNGLPWGLGASHALNVPSNDANMIARAGFYRVGSASTVANVPDTNFGGVILHIPYSNNYSAQTYIMTSSIAGLMWVRHCNNGTWTAWRRVYTQGDILGTVSQASGIPTGALIETGSNTNGRYTRFADGTQICSRTATTVASTDTALSWPAAFINATYSVSVTTTNNLPQYGACGEKTETTFTPRLWSAAATRVTGNADVIAIGRWF